MTAQTNRQGDTGFWYSVGRSLVTHYWPFTVIVLAFVTIGMAVAPRFDPSAFGVMLLTVWITLEGFHSIDLAAPDLTLDVDSRVQRTLGYVQVALGGALGVWLAAGTTWSLLAFVIVGIGLGLAYNEEWFDGLLHDRDRLTGLASFGIAWGAIPVLGGYVVLARSISLGAVFIALGCALFAVTLNMLEGPAKEHRYEQLGVEHARDSDTTVAELERKAHTAQLINAGTFVCLAVGLLLLYGPIGAG